MKKLPRKYQPKGFEILFEDKDIIVGNKAAGFLTVAALWNKDQTIHSALNDYVRKGSSHSKKSVYVVHRLDQATSGVLMFAKTEEAQIFLKENWKTTEKIYHTIVFGNLKKKSGLISSYLSEDEDYHVHSDKGAQEGKLSHTEYKVIKETDQYSLLEIRLLTGRKNQIRVHLSGEGHPIVGDDKYGKDRKNKNLALHSLRLTFTHPFSKKRLSFEAPPPPHFERYMVKFLSRGA